MTSREGATRSLGDAKAHFAECVRQAERGQSIVLTRHGRPVARLVPYEESASDAGWLRGAGRLHGGDEVRERQADYDTRPIESLPSAGARRAALERLLAQEIWPLIPKKLLGKGLSKKEREEILGYSEDGA